MTKNQLEKVMTTFVHCTEN